jgi:hypothetical protein
MYLKEEKIIIRSVLEKVTRKKVNVFKDKGH